LTDRQILKIIEIDSQRRERERKSQDRVRDGQTQKVRNREKEREIKGETVNEQSYKFTGRLNTS